MACTIISALSISLCLASKRPLRLSVWSLISFCKSAMMAFFSSYLNNWYVASSVRLAPSFWVRTPDKRALILSSSICSLSKATVALSSPSLIRWISGSRNWSTVCLMYALAMSLARATACSKSPRWCSTCLAKSATIFSLACFWFSAIRLSLMANFLASSIAFLAWTSLGDFAKLAGVARM